MYNHSHRSELQSNKQVLLIRSCLFLRSHMPTVKCGPRDQQIFCEKSSTSMIYLNDVHSVPVYA